MNRNFKRTSLKKWFFNIFSVFIDTFYEDNACLLNKCPWSLTFVHSIVYMHAYIY